jgi:glutamate synthase (NADPH/NADH) small chain
MTWSINSDWQEASRNLHSTNNFPEFTGRICPAPCEASCTLNIDDNPVTIKTIECAIVDRPGMKAGSCRTFPTTRPARRSPWSAPAPPAWQQPSSWRAGHDVHVYEKQAKPGGLLRYGIPDFKMSKQLIDRRVKQMEAEGVTFHCNRHVGVDTDVAELERTYDAVLLAGGSEAPRDLPVPGRELDGVHFAMDFLRQQNKRVSKEDLGDVQPILAEGKHVVVIGGGDTGSDCIGTSIRQGALSVTQLEIMPAPPEKENKALSWPHWPMKMRTSSSQAEGAKREFAVMTTKFSGENGKVKTLHGIQVDASMNRLPATEFELPADLVLLAMGFTNPVHEGMLKDLSVTLDPRGNVKADTVGYKTNRWKVFSAGDMRRGQSLVVWAIREGRQAARAIDEFLMGTTLLPR